MDFARIQRDTTPITLSEWNAVIAAHTFLQRMPDRTGINPFTKENVLFSGEGKAYYLVEGERAGNASLENGEILTTGISYDECEKIAQAMNARVIEDDRS